MDNKNLNREHLGRTVLLNLSTFASSPVHATKIKSQSVVADDAGIKLDDLKNHVKKMEMIAEGGQGILSQAVDQTLQRQIAVKTLRQEFASDQKQREDFISEAKITAQLDHPAVIPIHSLNQDEGNSLAVTMKLIHGKTFKKYLKETVEYYQTHGFRASEERKALRTRLEIFLKICDALEYAHSKNVMHCDLKPDNIMIGAYHEAYLMDWGIAHPIHSEEYDPATWVRKQEVHGTPSYIAPETVRGEYADHRADIYSMGLILFETVTLKTGITGDSVPEIIKKVKSHGISGIKHLFNFPIDRDMKSIISKATAFPAKDRYETMADFSADIRRYLKQDEVMAKPDNFLRKVFRNCIVHHGKALLITTLICVLAATGIAAKSFFDQLQRQKSERLRNRTLATRFIDCLDVAYKFDYELSRMEHDLNVSANFLCALFKGEVRVPEQTKHIPFNALDYAKKELVPKSYHKSPSDLDPCDFERIGYLTLPGLPSEKEQKYISTAGAMFLNMRTSLFASLLNGQLPSDQRIVEKDATKRNIPVTLLYMALDNGFYFTYPGKAYRQGHDPRKRPWYKTRIQSEKRSGWSTPYLNANASGIVISYTVRFGENTDYLGVAALDLNVGVLLDFLRNYQKQSPGLLERTFVDSNGMIIGTSNTELSKKVMQHYNSTADVKGYIYPNPNLIRIMRRNGRGITEMQENGKTVYYIYTQCSRINWFYFEKIDLQQCLNAQKEIERNVNPEQIQR